MYGIVAVVTGPELTLVCVLELVLLSMFRVKKSPISLVNFCPRSDFKGVRLCVQCVVKVSST